MTSNQDVECLRMDLGDLETIKSFVATIKDRNLKV